MAIDPNYSDVILLLNCDGVNNGTTFTDASLLAQTITVGADAKTTTAQAKFGNTSFTTIIGGLTATNAAYALGTGDFTIECWVYAPTGTWNSLSGYFPIVQIGSTGSGLIALYLDNNAGSPFVRCDGYTTGWVTLASPSPLANIPTSQWVHVALTRSGTTFKIWVDGVEYATGTNSMSFTQTLMYVGVDNNGNTIGPGFMDDIRITKGVARYTATFTPPTEAFPIPPEPNFFNVTTLLHMDGADNGTTFTESGPLSTTVSAVAGAVTSTAQSKFGSASVLLNGTTDAVTVSGTGLDLGSGDFTIECFVRVTTDGVIMPPAQYPVVFMVGDYNTDQSVYIGYDPQVPEFYAFAIITSTNFETLGTFGGSPTTGTWYHLALTRSGNNVDLWIDGVSGGSTTTTLNSPHTTYRIGYDGSSTNDGFFKGNIDEVRVTKGVARYTATFTPPTAAFPDDSAPAVPLEDTLTQNLTAADVLAVAFRVNRDITSGIVASDAVDALYTRAARVTEPVTIAEGLAPVAKFSQTLIRTVRTTDAIASARPVAVIESTQYSDDLGFVQAVTAIEQLQLTRTLAAGLKYRVASTDTVRWADSLRNFFGEDFSDNFEISSVLSPVKAAVAQAADVLNISDALGRHFILKVVAQDGVNLDDIDALSMIFSPTVVDGVEITAAYISPNGSLTTWAVNTENGAVTEYSNYGFNSFAQMGYKYIGASSAGLFELNGDDDAGTDIVSIVKSGLAQFGGSRFSMFKAAYLGVRGGGNFVLRMETGDGRFYDYNVVAQDMQTTKIRFGKGLRARYFSYQLTSTGQDFDMDSIEFVPVVAQRRV